tara:strand:+ start:305 stop:556 length:252 start_codon:yes stop_codon:yes gene_type:complete
MKKQDHSKILGVDYDPKGDMKLKVDNDGNPEVKFKGQDISFDSYIDEIEERATRNQEGKSITAKSIGSFAGWGKGKLKKPYKS